MTIEGLGLDLTGGIGSIGMGNADRVRSLNCGSWVALLQTRNPPTTSSHHSREFSGRGAVRSSVVSLVTLVFARDAQCLEDGRTHEYTGSEGDTD